MNGACANEAASAGLPILSSIYAGASTDLVREGINGFHMNPLDPDDVVGVITRATSLPASVRLAWGASSFEHCERIGLPFFGVGFAFGSFVGSKQQTDCQTGKKVGPYQGGWLLFTQTEPLFSLTCQVVRSPNEELSAAPRAKLPY